MMSETVTIVTKEEHRDGIPMLLYFTKEEEEILYRYTKSLNCKDFEEAIIAAILEKEQ